MTSKLTMTAADKIRFTPFGESIKVRIKDETFAAMYKSDFDAMFESLQYINNAQIVDPQKGERVTVLNLHEQENLIARLAPMYNGTDSLTGLPCGKIDHKTATLALVNHYSSYAQGDVLRISATNDAITFTRSGSMCLDIQDSYNIANTIAEDLIINIAAAINTADNQAGLAYHCSNVKKSHALMHRQLTQALTVLEAAQKAFDNVQAALIEQDK